MRNEFVCAGLYLLTFGCAAPIEQAADAKPSLADKETASYGESVPPSPTVSVSIPRSQRLGDDGSVTFALHNERDVIADVVVSLTAVSEHGLRSLPNLAHVTLPAEGSQSIQIAASTLALPRGTYSLPGHITVELSSQYEDGVEATVSAPPLFFQPEGAGFALYDSEARDARPDRGALSEAAQAVLRVRPGTMFSPAYVPAEDELRGEGERYPSPSAIIPEWEEDLEALEQAQTYLGLPALVRESGDKQRPSAVVEGKAANVTTRFCITQRTQFTDSNARCPDVDGACEDQYTSASATNRTTIGNYWEILNSSGQMVASGLLGDGLSGRTQGCTAGSVTLASGVQHSFLIWSLGNIGGSAIAALAPNNDVASIATPFTLSSTPSAISNLVAVPTGFETAQNAYVAAAFALSRNPPGVTFPPHLEIRVCSSSCATFADGGGNFIQLSRFDAVAKFVIAHELGHCVMIRNIGTSALGYDGTDNHDTNGDGTGDGACLSSTGNDHRLTSREFISAAAVEGFGNFWAAAAFNNATQATDCWFNAPGNVWLDCAFTRTHVNAWMNNRCSPSQTFGDRYTGRGNESDWAKTFWQLRTRSSSNPSMNGILRWMRDANDATAYTRNNWYVLLDNEANDTATNGTALNANWDAVKFTNGINH